MNRKCFVLQARDWFEDDVYCRLFSTKKKADEHFKQYGVGVGIIYEVRCVNNRRFYEGIIVNKEDIKGV